jgi:hypothetical protein
MKNLAGKNVLIVQGSMLDGHRLTAAFKRAGSTPYLTANMISAYELLRRIRFGGAVLDSGLHNEAYDLCTELQAFDTPYICCQAPHRLQGPILRNREAENAVRRLSHLLAGPEDLLEGLPMSAPGRGSGDVSSGSFT